LKKHLKNVVFSVKYLKIVSYLKRKDILAELVFMYSSSELLTKFYLQVIIVGELVELVLDAQKLILAERQGFHGRERRHFKATADHTAENSVQLTPSNDDHYRHQKFSMIEADLT